MHAGYHQNTTMIVRTPQRTQDDCAICTVAMVMGTPYSYERVLADSAIYPKISSDGRFSAWWETYFRDLGFESTYCYFDGLRALRQYPGAIAGMLGVDIPRLNRGHIVAVDEIGVIDPADNAPDDVPLDAYVRNHLQDGVIFHTEWLAVRKLRDLAIGNGPQ
jgi:hypothetical protein